MLFDGAFNRPDSHTSNLIKPHPHSPDKDEFWDISKYRYFFPAI